MKIGLTNGCFDLLHSGHRIFLIECARQCDFLIVAVNGDEYCRTKGPGRPLKPLKSRMAEIRDFAFELQCGGEHFARISVIPFKFDPNGLIYAIQPDVVFRGEDQEDVDAGITVPVVRIGRVPGYSTTIAAAQRSFK